MNNQPNYDMAMGFLQIFDVLLNLNQVSNDTLLEELQRQNKEYLEKIVKQNEEIIKQNDELLEMQRAECSLLTEMGITMARDKFLR
jgi:NifU-like protein involved in Fe-S cluster formation